MKRLFHYLLVSVVAIGLLDACSTKKSEQEAAVEAYSVSAEDSARIVGCAAAVLDMMQVDDYAGAADALAVFNAEDSTFAALDEGQRSSLNSRAKVFPVKSYSVYSTEFKSGLENVVVFDVAFGEADAEGNAPVTKMGFNVIVDESGLLHPTLREKHF